MMCLFCQLRDAREITGMSMNVIAHISEEGFYVNIKQKSSNSHNRKIFLIATT